MSSRRTHRVLFDGEAFVRHRRSGITRYFAELIAEFRANASLGVEPVTPYRYVANAHLIDKAPGSYRHIPLPRRWRSSVLGRLNARGIRASGRADIVHHSIYEPSALESWAARKRVSTVYDFSFDVLPELFGYFRSALGDVRLFLERSDVLVCISQTTRDDLRRFHPDLEKPVVVAPLGVSEEFLAPRPARIRGLPDRYLLHVGNRHVHKNVDVLFRAFAEVCRSDPSLHLVLSGASLPTESARLRELGISERTVVLRATEEQLPWLYRKASVFVFPSRYEGFGLPVLEAMATGCPTVVSNAPALLETADEAALFFAPDDVDTLVDHVRRLLADPCEVERLRHAGRCRAAAFPWKRTAEATASAYDLAADA